MDAEKKIYRYMEWKTPEEMHFSVLQWISSLDFIRDENKFLEEILKEFTIPLLEAHFLNKAKDLVTRLSLVEQQEQELSKKLSLHRNNLKIMTDGMDPPEEENKYKEEHKNLDQEISSFTEKYRVLKKEIFEMISVSLKKQKQGRLLP